MRIPKPDPRLYPPFHWISNVIKVGIYTVPQQYLQLFLLEFTLTTTEIKLYFGKFIQRKEAFLKEGRLIFVLTIP